MIPTGGVISTTDPYTESQRTSATYSLDFDSGRMGGRIDGLSAVKQAVFKILQTQRYKFAIYSFDYGFEKEGLIGAAPGLIRAEMIRRVKEALLQDDRITDVADFQITIMGDAVTAAFQVVTDEGAFTMEVRQNV